MSDTLNSGKIIPTREKWQGRPFMPNCMEPVDLEKGLLRDQQGAWILLAAHLLGEAHHLSKKSQPAKYDTQLALHHKIQWGPEPT